MLSCSPPPDGCSSNAGTPEQRWRPSPRRPASPRESSTPSSRASPTCSWRCSTRRIAERAEQNALVSAGLAGLDGLRALLDANVRLSEEGGDWSRLLIEFRLIAAREPVLNARYAALHAQTLEHLTEAIASILARAGLRSAYPPRTFAELIVALDAGRVLERAAGTSELQLEHLVDLLGRALVPAGSDDHTGTNTPHPGGHHAHDDRSEAPVPRTP